MKNLIVLILSFSAIFHLTSCAQQADVNQMMQNEETREEVYEAITEDDQMMNEFMDHMQRSDRAMGMMRGHQHMMGSMMQDEGAFMNRMQNNPQFRDHMMNMMMDYQPMMMQMMNHMHQQGVISDDCFQSMNQMMEEQGMME